MRPKDCSCCDLRPRFRCRRLRWRGVSVHEAAEERGGGLSSSLLTFIRPFVLAFVLRYSAPFRILRVTAVRPVSACRLGGPFRCRWWEGRKPGLEMTLEDGPRVLGFCCRALIYNSRFPFSQDRPHCEQAAGSTAVRVGPSRHKSEGCLVEEGCSAFSNSAHSPTKKKKASPPFSTE